MKNFRLIYIFSVSTYFEKHSKPVFLPTNFVHLILPLFILRKVKVEVHNERKIMRILNVVGTLKGSVEPGQLIVLAVLRLSFQRQVW